MIENAAPSDKPDEMRKQAEEALADAKHLVGRILNSAPIVLYIYEVTPEDVREDATPVFGRLHPDDYDGITDVVMPEMNGRDLAEHLLSPYPTITRLFTSGYTADIIARHGVLDEGVHFIQKPFSARALAAKVRQALKARK